MSGTITHEWNGTVLTITSDSGTSSADLQGEMGVRGPQGTAGGQYIPEKGVDYLTEEEVAELFNEVDIHIDNEVKPYVGDYVDTYTEDYVKPYVADYVDENAAPAGWGYGGTMEYIINEEGTFEADLDVLLADMPNYSVKQIQFYDTQGLIGYKFFGTVWKYTDSYATVEAITYHGLKAIKRMYGGEWLPWEWVNPPMAPNTEYRTIERYNGNPVYIQRFNAGALAQGEITIEHNLGLTSSRLVGMDAYAKSTTNTICYPLPMISSSGNISAAIRNQANSIVIYAFSDLSGYDGHVTLRYCKP